MTGCYFMWLATAIIPSASENIRLVSVFNSDEATQLELLRQALSQGTLRIDYSQYGHLQFNLALIPLFLMSFLAPVTDQSIIIALRLVSAVAGAATVLCTFFLARRYFGRLVGWVSACLLCGISLNFIEWSVYAHPDVPQLFFLMLGLYFCCRLGGDKSRESLVLASASAGLAFACKYSGLFLLPVIWLVAVGGNAGRDEVDPFRSAVLLVRKWARGLTLAAGMGSVLLGLVMRVELVARFLTSDGAVESSNLPVIREFRILLGVTGCALIVLGILRWPWRVVARSELVARTLSQVGISVAAFITAFVIGSPFSLWKLNFLNGMISQSRHVAFGHIFRGEGGVQGWLSLLVSQDLLGVTFTAIAAVGFLYLFHDLVTKEAKHLSIGQRLARQVIRPEVILWLWVLLYLSFLVVRVRMLEPRYLLPVLPVLLILSVQFLAQLARASLGAASRKLALPVLVLFLVFGAVDFASSITRVQEFRATE
ncbi:MAG: glycosyltransferase family 39 protein, partial [Acidobacteria bacterium]|nr:glycosyltransferase family 39 protein [Acidobacteriota bacterium]